MNNTSSSSHSAAHARTRRLTRGLSAGLVVLLAACNSAGSVSDRLDQAAANLSSHDYRAAEVRAKSVLRDDKNNGRAWLVLGKASLARHRYDDAVHQFERAGASGQGEEAFVLDMARAELGAQNYNKALEGLENYKPGDDKTRVDALTLRGDALSALKQTDAADQAFKQALQINADAPGALIGQAQLAVNADNEARAMTLLQHAADANPDNLPALAALARMNYRQNQCVPALDGFSKVLESGDRSLTAGTVFQLRASAADCQLRLRRDDAAKRNIDLLLKAAPQSGYANYLQGLLNLRGGDYDEAATHLQRVLNVDPDNLRTMTLLAYVAIARKDADTAQTYLRRVLARSPDNVDALRLQAGLYLKHGDRQKALDMLRNAYQSNSDTPGLRPLLAQVMAGLDGASDSAAGKQESGGAMDAALQLDLAAALAEQGSPSAAMTLLDKFEPKTDEQRARVSLIRIRIDLESGQKDKAVAEAEKLAAAHDNDASVLRGLARVYLLAGRADDAASTLDKAHAKAPDDRAVVQDQIRLSVQRGKLDEARTRVKSLLQKAPDDSGLILQLAQIDALGGDSSAMLSTLKDAHARQPDALDVSQALVQAYQASNQPARARKLAEQRMANHPDQANVLRLAGMTQLADNAPDKALETLQRAVEASNNDPGYRLDLAQVQLASGHVDEAVTLLKQIRRENAEFSPAARMLALAQARAGQVDDALATVDSLQSDSAVTSTERDKLQGDVLSIGKRYASAAKAYAKVYEASPSQAVALDLFNARRNADIAQPERSLIDWLSQSPKDVATALRLGQWYQSQDQRDEAIKAYESALAIQDGNVIALNNLALILHSKDDDQKALSMARRAQKSAPESGAVADTLGWMLVQTGDNTKGLKYLRMAADKSDTSAEIRYHLAYALVQAGQADQKTQAREILKTALSDNQPFAERDKARRLLDRLSSSGNISAAQ